MSGLLMLLMVLSFSQTSLGFEVPRLKGAINDNASLLSSKYERSLEVALADFRKRGGAHIALLTVDSLEGSAIEQASIQVVDRWKLGGESQDNGVLLLIAKEDKKIRIEVGQGLEGALPDIYAKRIISDTMTPLFRDGEFAKGIYLGLYQIAQKTNPEIPFLSSVDSSARKWKRKKKKTFGFQNLIFILLFIFFFITGGRSPLFAFLLGSSLGHGSRGGFGGGSFGGGGGFSGGGGGFSGGGASGGW